MTPGTTINLSRLKLPTSYVYNGYDLPRLTSNLLFKPVIAWQDMGLVKRNDSFGLVVANLDFVGRYDEIWDNPVALIGFAVMWGPEGRRYALNALRKIRASARENVSTLDIASDCPEAFRDAVPSITDDPANPYLWGDFPHPGAVFAGLPDEPYRLLVGVSGLAADEDDAVAEFAGKILRRKLLAVDKAMSAG